MQTIELIFDEFVSGTFRYVTPTPYIECPSSTPLSDFQSYTHPLYLWQIQFPIDWEANEPFSDVIFDDGAGTKYTFIVLQIDGGIIALDIWEFFAVGKVFDLVGWSDLVVDTLRASLTSEFQDTVQILRSDNSPTSREIHVEYQLAAGTFRVFIHVEIAKGSGFAVLVDIPIDAWSACQSLASEIVQSFVP